MTTEHPEASEGELHSGLVALVGWTNVGKSTLLNRLVGTKIAAVADVSQTTRHPIRGVVNVAGRGQIVFVDTPGLHQPHSRMNRAMVDSAIDALGAVDVAVQVVDASRDLGAGDHHAAKLVARSGVGRLLALNKIDELRRKSKLLPMIELATGAWGFDEAIPISAKTGEGCEVLVERLLATLPSGPPLFPEDYLTDQPERVLVAEFVREKLLSATRQELPHATAVLVERWTESDDDMLHIEATVLVERESQKPIVIGREGSLLKKIGSTARLELEQLLGRRIYLRLWVKVQRDWRNDRGVLRDLGLH